MATDENINKLQRKRFTLRSKVTRLTGKLNDADGIDKAFDVELLEDTLKDLKLMNETIHDLLNDEDYERYTVDCEKYFDTANLSLVDKHVFLRGNLDGEAKRLVDGIGDTYETTKKLLEDKYGDKDRIIHSHLDYLENLKPVQHPSPMELNDLYIECNRRFQALNALGENTEAYGRILAPKSIRTFPTEICCHWIIYAKREKLAEGNITRLMQFLAEEVEGSVEAQKIRGTLFPDNILKSSVENFNIDSKLVNKNGRRQASFVDVKLMDKLKLNVIHSSSLRVQAFEYSFTQEQRRCVWLTLSGLWSKQSILITAFESNNTYTTHPAATIEISQFAHKNKLKLADPPDNSSLPIELLIGGDYYWQIVTAESPIMLSDSFVMVPSMLGWILSGSRTHTIITDNTFVHQFSVQVSNYCLNDQDTNDDTLNNAFKTSFCVAGDKPFTKRWLLRCIASCYDPLGLLSPFTIIGKILFQETWILGIKWDELLPTNLSTMWYAAVKQLDDICSIKISRYIGISSHTPYSVHVFCDASERAYGSVLYIVTSQSNVHIVCSRNRLGPVKKVTLPRLELLAALMGTRLLKYFCKEVDIQPSAATLWTDSKITLSWIRSNPNK
ncbi:integrase catalytic domain-containing protein [Nephila pilipes]|uniref:Integrase catalytic domain-containing protein n=1 Tax=Nephila pilipes TaxID=299642 RepID=A0A8X6UJF3_NEPPI|nr:integrase catalytic domain-containing protein [Nephila pilipes]